jgi:hypothetical protein
MAKILCSFIVLGIVAGFSSGISALKPIKHFDTMGDVSCEDEHARLDHFALDLNKAPDAKGVIMFYGGIQFRGRLPRRNEAAMRAARMKPYLVNQRGIPADRVVVINGGYRAEWEVEFWILSPGQALPDPQPLLRTSDVRFRKGKARPRDFRCHI